MQGVKASSQITNQAGDRTSTKSNTNFIKNVIEKEKSPTSK